VQCSGAVDKNTASLRLLTKWAYSMAKIDYSLTAAMPLIRAMKIAIDTG
jgi:hypothetical protein